MIASAHIAAGFVAGMAAARLTTRTVPRLALAFVIGVLSHVVLDAIPHSDYVPLAASTVTWVSLCEIVVTSSIAAFILRRRLLPHWPRYLLPGIAGAVIPDAKFLARLAFPKGLAIAVERYGDAFHDFFHANPPSRPAVGWALEITCTLLLLTILILSPRRATSGADRGRHH